MVTSFEKNIDLITLEVIRNRLESIVREMADITLRTARSSVVYNSRDFSCGLLTNNTELLAIGTSVPVHIFPTVSQVKIAIERFKEDIQPGDIFIGNDPFEGGSHLNDVLIFVPIFFEGEIVSYACNRAHWYDVGGMVPGSLSGSSREIFQEGLRIPSIRIGRNGSLDPNILSLIMRNVRVPDEATGDLWAQLASCRVGAQRVVTLMERYGKDEVLLYFNEILDSTERRMRNIIRALPKGTVSHEGYVDNDGVTPEPRPIKVTITIKEDSILVDYTGTASQSLGPMNVGFAVGMHYPFIGVKSALDPKGPVNHGCFRPIETIIPEGTMLNARPPAPVAGQGELGQTAILTMVALAKLVPFQICAEEGPSANHQTYSGMDSRDVDHQKRFIYYDVPSAGGGARVNKDGLDYVRSVRIGNTNVPSIEVLENIFPFHFQRHELRLNSGGPGKYRGGLGGIREYVATVDGVFSMLSDNSVVPCGGVQGGESGAPMRFDVIRDGELSPISPEFGSKGTSFPVKTGDVIRISTPGGGGYGDPLERDPASVIQDVLDEKVSEEQARHEYGVVLSDDMTRLNESKTSDLRVELASRRIYLTPTKGASPVFEGGVRVAYVSGCLKDNGFVEGEMVEICAPNHPATFRVRAEFDDNLPSGVVALDNEAWDMLSLEQNDRLWWRKLRTTPIGS